MADADNVVTALCDRVWQGGLSPYLATNAAAQRGSASQKADFEDLPTFLNHMTPNPLS